MVAIVMWTVIFLFIVQLCLLSALVISKIQSLKEEQLLSTYMETYEEPFFAYLERKTEEYPHLLSDIRYRVLIVERVLNRFVDQREDGIEYTRVRETAQTHLAHAYRLFLKNGSWSQRVNTLYYIEDFDMVDLKLDVWHYFNRLPVQDEEFRQAVRLLATFQDERVIRTILNSETISQRLVKQVLRRFKEDLIQQMMRVIEDEPGRVPRHVHLAVVSFCGEKGSLDHLPFIERMLRFPSKEIRLKALRSLMELKACTHTEQLDSFYISEVWEERMYAAKIAGRLKLESSQDALLKLAGDSEWWVRYAACEAMKKLPDGDRLLDYTYHHHEDRFARSMARQHLTVKVGESI
ncbi:HEAT repeat domain-containing protein [Halobacillus trueperi]|uniref:HEAT repeat domain-containing protein n=1 Tax=Halobacillus trueperi TaxID=156205 RepID=A0A3E0JBW3_9BACI|nr:HEAT repeat domain-containing protein [Halobacillus trueperi]REJ10401.1 HEAT repeat domain-containing protein [Halobacillus trueperi]